MTAVALGLVGLVVFCAFAVACGEDIARARRKRRYRAAVVKMFPHEPPSHIHIVGPAYDSPESEAFFHEVRSWER